MGIPTLAQPLGLWLNAAWIGSHSVITNMGTPVTPCSTPDSLTSGFPVPAADGSVPAPEEEAVRWKNLQPVIQREALRKRKTNIVY